LNDEPAGNPVAEKLTTSPTFTDAAVMVKLIQVPATTVWFPGTARERGTRACTLTVLLAVMLACGEAESVTVTLAV
jgi:hypothetical protein